MHITWGNIFSVIMKMFAINTAKLANHIKINRGTISRHINGEITHFTSLSPDKLYEIVFDPINMESLANKLDTTEEWLLESLKKAVAKVGIQKTMTDLWDKKYEEGDYAKFTKAMLARIGINQIPSSNGSSAEHPVVEYDEAFDSQILKLRLKMNQLNELLSNEILYRNDVPVIEFCSEFEKVVLIGRSLSNPIGWLRPFITEFSNLFSNLEIIEKQMEYHTMELGRHSKLLLRDIRKLIYNYILIRNGYLLTRKIALPEDATPVEQMLIIFNQVIRDWYIYEYIYGRPISSIWGEEFSKSISKNIQREFEYQINKTMDSNIKDIYGDIIEFTELLINYNLLIGFLSPQLSHSNSGDFLLEDEGDSEERILFKKTTIKNHKQLILLYNRIINASV